jgi:hypothetical protein
MFVAKLDDEILADLAPEQLEALADRAWRRRKRNAPDAAEDERPDYTHMLRIHTTDAEATKVACERTFTELFVRWKYMGRTKAGDGLKIVEYGVAMHETITPGVVHHTLKQLPDGGVRLVEMKK